jgi:hypothetical protein
LLGEQFALEVWWVDWRLADVAGVLFSLVYNHVSLTMFLLARQYGALHGYRGIRLGRILPLQLHSLYLLRQRLRRRVC